MKLEYRSNVGIDEQLLSITKTELDALKEAVKNFAKGKKISQNRIGLDD